MTLEYAILGLLSWQPFSGYDLKRIFEDSPVYHWSGNNNQIYRTLVNLHNEGLVERDIQQQESLPARKVYSLTPQGHNALRHWLNSTPSLPLRKHEFLIQLGWADQLSSAELDSLLSNYEDEVFALGLLVQASVKNPQLHPARTMRENLLWDSIAENWSGYYQYELEWVRNLRRQLQTLEV
ncbi:MAG: PadR family transcriptional regulator [Chloroflexi bacterium HGW-Chloroflexi-10]|nr:MAG: PadR family transcriptional regulator [Chloroflexi bacterium HGW-Chloroflexi-10]